MEQLLRQASRGNFVWARRRRWQIAALFTVGERATYELRSERVSALQTVYDACTQLPAFIAAAPENQKIKFQPDQENHND